METAADERDEAIRRFDFGWMPGPLMRRCEQRSEDLFAEVVGRDGPTPRQIAVMIALTQKPGSSLADVAAATGIDRNTVSEMVGRMVARKLVQRRRSPADSRAWLLTLTPAGQDVVRDAFPRAAAVQEMILAPLPPDLRPLFIEALRILAGLESPPNGETTR